MFTINVQQLYLLTVELKLLEDGILFAVLSLMCIKVFDLAEKIHWWQYLTHV